MINKIFSLKVRAVVAVLFVTLLSSCVTTISPEQMRKEVEGFKLPKSPDKNSAVVYVVRPSMVGTIVRFNVFLDNKEDSSEMGYNRGNEYIYFSVTPGEHRIFSKAENWDDIEFNAETGKAYFVKQTPGMGFIMARNSLSLLDENQGKYEVKNSKIGTIKKLEK